MEKSKERVFNDATIIVLGHMKASLDKALSVVDLADDAKVRVQRRYDLAVRVLNEHANLTRNMLIEMGEAPDADALIVTPLLFYGAVSEMIFGADRAKNATPV